VDAEGSMTVDDVSLACIQRDQLRQKIIVVSDDPFFISGGNLRGNLDPLSCCSDDAMLIDALRDVTLWETFVANATKSHGDSSKEELGGHMAAENALDAPFASDTLSHGQKQLFALARALVRQLSKGPVAGGLVILDEATSRTDKKTDSIIQAVIRKHFHSCTLLVIAHRLEGILDFDQVVVLETGRVAEVESPNVLRMKKGSLFRSMLENN
jgi:ATP-binding cassette subfamily C (CFTR/MRP) protein 1